MQTRAHGKPRKGNYLAALMVACAAAACWEERFATDVETEATFDVPNDVDPGTSDATQDADDIASEPEMDAAPDATRPTVDIRPCTREDCEGDAFCLNGFCRYTCLSNADCTEAEPLCDVLTGTCGVCSSDFDCPEGSRCESGVCQPRCSTPEACADGEVCVEGWCVQPACQVGSMTCAGSSLLTCSAAGEFALVRDCAASAMTCDYTEAGAACIPRDPCETIFAGCTRAGRSQPASRSLNVVPLDNLQCEISNSFDADHDETDYLWRVVEQPDGSTTRFQSDDRPVSTLFIDLAGEYRLSVTAIDRTTTASCEAFVQLRAQYDEDLSLQLTWDTSGDPDQTDQGLSSGSDIDVHYLNTSIGCWTQSSDCHWRHICIDWGQPGNSTDDPCLDLDDVNGAGPENINHDNIPPGRYSAGVNYYDDHGFGESTATLRIFFLGILVLEKSRVLQSGEFWHVADIDWPSQAIRLVDQVYPNIADATCE